MDNLSSKIKDVLGIYYLSNILKETPKNVIKIYFDKIFFRLKPINMLKIALFDNKYKFNQILVEKNTAFYSNCDYHLVPTMGKTIEFRISYGKVIGLSKINQIANKLQTILSTGNVTVIIDAKQFCVSSGNIRDDT